MGRALLPQHAVTGALRREQVDHQPLGGVVGGRHDVGDRGLGRRLQSLGAHPGGQGAGVADQPRRQRGVLGKIERRTRSQAHAQASASSARVSESSWGSTLVPPRTVM